MGRRLANEGLALARQSQQDDAAGLGLFALGRSALRDQDFQRAVLLFEESVTLFRAIGSEWLTYALSGLGSARAGLGDDVRAADAFAQALHEARVSRTHRISRRLR